MAHKYMTRSCLLLLALSLFSLNPLLAKTITVTSTADSGSGTLRQAIMMAADGDEIVFSSSLDGNAIMLNGQITVAKSIWISGNGMGTTLISGNMVNRIFQFGGMTTVMVRDLTLYDGMSKLQGGGIRIRRGTDVTLDRVEIRNCRSTANSAQRGGGGIANAGMLTLNDSKITGNFALGTSGSGGGILNEAGGTLTINRGMVSKNEANRAGGGIEDASGGATMFEMNNVLVRENVVYTAPGNGGGIHIGGDGSLTMVDGVVNNNTAGAEGGGIWVGSGTLSISKTLIRGNVAMGNDADQGGGGLYSNGNGTIELMNNVRVFDNKATGTSGSGGGILNGIGATLMITDSEVSRNEANRAGGGIEDISNDGSMFTITNSMIHENVVNNAPGNGGGIHIGGNGSLTVTGGSVRDNQAGAEGGGIWNNQGVLTVTGGTLIRGNIAMGNDADQGGGGLYNNGGGTIIVEDRVSISENKATGASGSGGGILNGVGATLIVRGSAIARNNANRAGGGIEDISGGSSMFTITDSRITENRVNYAPGNGAGIHVGGDGNLTVTGSIINENCAGAEGGGIWNGTGTLSVTDTEISTNIAGGDAADQGGAGLYNNGGGRIELTNVRVTNNRAFGAAGSGGGILNNVGGTLIVMSSRITGNEANRAGGGIEDASGAGSEVTIMDTRISMNVVNRSPGNGGGIHIGSDGDVTIVDGTVNANRAGAEGGGIWNGMGTLTIKQALIRDNVALGDDADQGGGGLYNNGGGTILLSDNVRILNNRATGTSGSGGGILNNTGATLTLTGVEVSGNEANRAGGGIEDASGSGSMVTITDSKIEMNRVNTAPGNGGGIHVGSDGDLTITGGTVRDNSAGAEGGGLWNGLGVMEVNNVTVWANVAEGNAADNGGGGIFNNGGILMVTDSKLRDNKATGASGSGGGVFSTDGSVTIDNTLLIRNSASRAGGGVEIVDGSFASNYSDYESNDAGSSPGNGGAFHVTGMMSTVDFVGGSATYNVAANEGGGIWNQSGTMMSIMDMSILYNRVTDPGMLDRRVGGGGVFNNSGILDIEGSTIAYNTATGGKLTAGGGIANNTGGTVTLMRSTVSNNEAGLVGGGIANDGMIEITNTTITRNMAPAAGGFAQATPAAMLTITGSIVADNRAKLAHDFGTLLGQVTSGGYNLIGDDSQNQFPAQSTDKEGLSAMLRQLGDNGGMTMTHVPLCGSPVINMGNPADNSPDQIGQAVFGGTRDIGSFERQSFCGGGYDQSITRNDDVLTDNVSVYPNPVVSDYLSVNLPAHFSGDVLLRIISSEGRVTNAGTVQSSNHRLDLSSFVPGAYTLQVRNGEETQTVRFVISR
ncbi:choice-of-anchor Q domain-containing protein [Lewinella sp. IMCC34183]|uniref:choice-of-anchor Q domain-containing protein n=1 Tax=Lewinella sp. IMCC34183 TaxID=2248762 RepID=UPI000E2480C8|nr:choice-of-anchor Q domain-containing protein [Lewinella sp. IMCC34183]